MAIQMRRGAYGNFDDSKLLPGEWAIVLQDDPSAQDGLAAYISFAAGTSKRIATWNDLLDWLNNNKPEVYAAFTTAVDDARNAAGSANTNASAASAAADSANKAATSANNAASSANTATDAAKTATTAANKAADRAITAVTVSTLDAGADATAALVAGTDGQTLALGIPRGAQGVQGPKGDRGETGATGPKGDSYVLTDADKAEIAAVNADGTLDVTIDGTTLRGVCATTGCVGAAEGMRCVVLRQGPLATVVGLIAGHDLGNIVLPNRKSIFGTDSHGDPLYVFEPRNLNDNAAINFRGYADANSSTEIYGNEINLVARDGVEVNGKYLPDGNVSIGYWSSSNAVTTTSTTTIGSLTHTSKTGHVLIAANMILATSRYTSSMQVYGQNTLIIRRGTNMTSPMRIDGIAQDHPTRGAAITYSLRMNSQDSGTTATFPGYSSAELIVTDI